MRFHCNAYCTFFSGIELAKYLYKHAGMYESRTGNGWLSHLHQLCLSKVPNLKLAEMLIKCGCCINAMEGNGRTPLMIAAQKKNEELVDLLLKYNASVWHIDLDYKNALQYAEPGENIHRMIEKAINLQQNVSKEGKGLIDGRLRTSQMMCREVKMIGSNVINQSNILCVSPNNSSRRFNFL